MPELTLDDVILDWSEWNKIPLPDGMCIYDPDGFRFGEPTKVTWKQFLKARGECTLHDRREHDA